MESKMFCFQCQETSKGTGCTIKGVCGKLPEVANAKDLLVYTMKGISIYTTKAREAGLDVEDEINRFVLNSMFITITNTNFNDEAILEEVKKGLKIRDELRERLIPKGVISEQDALHDAAIWNYNNDHDLIDKSHEVGVLQTENEDIRSLRELITYGVKGISAYAEHAHNLGYKDEKIYNFMQRALAATTNDNLSAEDLTNMVLETGQAGVETMALLDKANTSTYGNPEITKVNLGVRNNPGILISGHDLKDMEELLEQTKGTGVDVYTHSEMLPANYYPAFKKYGHFVGNYGSSWWKQKEEFESFNGPILFTTNCLVPPKKDAGYIDKVYTTGAVGYPGFHYIPPRKNGGVKDFSAIIEQAKQCDPPQALEEGEIVGGFAHNQVLALADKIVDAVKSGAIKKFFVMSGCDGRFKSRDYYTEFAKELPDDTVILTSGCAKYRYNKLNLGDIGGIPRVLDAGQCNDSYSWAVVAMKLKEVFGANDINDLPIAFNVAWYEQKAVIVLLALLSLGIKNIHAGPTMPAFLSPNVKNVLIEKFGLAGIGEPKEDVEMFMNK
jgi:hydroxylamine reductase